MTIPNASSKYASLSTRTSWWILIGIFAGAGMIWGFVIAWGSSKGPFNPIHWVGIERRAPMPEGAEIHVYVFHLEIYSRTGNRLEEFKTQQAIVESVFPVTLGLIGLAVGALMGRLVLGSFRRFSRTRSSI
jgi:hypothetical protein